MMDKGMMARMKEMRGMMADMLGKMDEMMGDSPADEKKEQEANPMPLMDKAKAAVNKLKASKPGVK